MDKGICEGFFVHFWEGKSNMDTYAIVLYFDAVTNDTINEIIKTISVITDNTYMIDVNIPPHITIGSFLCDESDRLMAEVGDFMKDVDTFQVKFDGVGAFEPKVLFASPVKDDYLEKINLAIHEILLENFQPADNEYYTPTKWIPHCALAVRLDEKQFQQARKVEDQIQLPMIAKVEKIALARCNPYEEIKVWEISQTP